MKPVQFARNLSVALATAGLLLPNAGVAFANGTSTAASTPAAAVRIVDVSLSEGGVLKGQVANSAGVVQTNREVKVQQGTNVVATAKTNAQGEFAVPGLKGGVYVVSTDGATGLVRAWAPRTAPPAAVPGVLLVHGDQAVLGQLGSQVGVAGIAVVALAATVVAVAIDHNDDAS